MRITPACAGKRMVFAGRKSRTWDHPRVCGEKVSSTSPIKCLKGSPPRMRGKVPQPGVEGCRLGITPACAGKSCRLRQLHGAYRDHPRVCGEKKKLSPNFTVYEGSPPRVRGKELRVETCFSHDGITPAYAGKRVSRSRAKTGEWDHPRVCGEKTPFSENSFTKSGSPPRMRGKEVYL